eukprot:1629339-Prymnesium_polylepis.2
MVITEHLKEEDTITLFSLGEAKALINKVPKAGNEERLKRDVQAVMCTETDALGNLKPKGTSRLYESINRALDLLRQEQDAGLWLIFLSDLVDFSAGNHQKELPTSPKVKQAMSQLKALADNTANKLKSVEGCNFIGIDASGIAKWCPQHPLWSTWKGNVDNIAKAAVANDAIGKVLDGSSPEKIAEAFEAVAEAMVEDAGGVAE